MLHSQKRTHSLLLDVREFLLEVIGESESHNWKTGVVVGGRFFVIAYSCVLNVAKSKHALLAVDIADASIPSGSLECLGQQSCVTHAAFHDSSVAIEAKVDEVVVLANDLSARSREIQGVALFRATQVVQLKDQMFGKIRLVSPDDPANTRIDKTEFMS